MNIDDPYIVTASGKRFHVLNPRDSEIDISDIAFALSNICRFTGHVEFYSVAQHSILVLDIVREMGGDWYERMWALLHDAAEAYISDLNSPTKNTLGLAAYRELETRVQKAIAFKFGLPRFPQDIVMDADFEAFKAEVGDLFPDSIRIADFRIRDSDLNQKYTDLLGVNCTPTEAREEFLREYKKLVREARIGAVG